jgi:hypothetical protein
LDGCCLEISLSAYRTPDGRLREQCAQYGRSSLDEGVIQFALQETISCPSKKADKCVLLGSCRAAVTLSFFICVRRHFAGGTS